MFPQLQPDLLVLVGPEGDFTMEEIEKCIDNGFQGISLGESRLRAETAAVVVCAQVQAAWQMKA
jgi:16S rRNA (uracil1498-N3)-methyltransferase